MYEDFVLLQNKRILSAIIYIGATIVLGIIACYLGTSFAAFLIDSH